MEEPEGMDDLRKLYLPDTADVCFSADVAT